MPGPGFNASFTLVSLPLHTLCGGVLGEHMLAVATMSNRDQSVHTPPRLQNSRPKHRDPSPTLGDIIEAPVALLRPTQIAVGMGLVARKLRKIQKRATCSRQMAKAIAKRPIPAVYGPGGQLFMVDHHHFGMALTLADVTTAHVRIVADASDLDRSAFWRRMEENGFLYPYDELGERVAPSELPRTLAAMRHDPFRDLAWLAREAGGFDKVSEPFAEFRWANYFRDNIPLSLIRREPKEALRRALKLSRSRAASRLPGYSY